MVHRFWVREGMVYNGKTDKMEPGPLAMLVMYSYDRGLVSYTTATCHPKDKFNRKVAHDRAEGLFRGGKYIHF